MASITVNNDTFVGIEINIATSFFWKHKILNYISIFLGVDSIDGIIESDEVFFAYSYKSTKTNNIPPPSRKRGISSEQVCVATTLNRQGNLIMELLCTDRMTSAELERLYGGYKEKNIVVDTKEPKISLEQTLVADSKRACMYINC